MTGIAVALGERRLRHGVSELPWLLACEEQGDPLAFASCNHHARTNLRQRSNASIVPYASALPVPSPPCQPRPPASVLRPLCLLPLPALSQKTGLVGFPAVDMRNVTGNNMHTGTCPIEHRRSTVTQRRPLPVFYQATGLVGFPRVFRYFCDLSPTASRPPPSRSRSSGAAKGNCGPEYPCAASRRVAQSRLSLRESGAR